MKSDPVRRHHHAFTLIELLVVIGIIVLLISLLLPALGKARDAGRTVACMSNMKQLGTAINGYANDYKGQIMETGHPTPFRFWYAQPTNPTLATTGVGGANPTVIGPIYEYLTYVDRAFECPTNKRRTPTRAEISGNDPMWNTPQNQLQISLFNEFLTPRAINFDYTMVTGASGARIDSTTQVAWDTQSCKTRTAQAARPYPSLNNLKYMNSGPAFMEEDVEWWNSRSPDGMFSNWDQLTNRHGGKGHITYINGDVELFKFPRGPDDLSQNDTGDWSANDIWVKGRGLQWYQLAPSWPATQRPYGWYNSPR